MWNDRDDETDSSLLAAPVRAKTHVPLRAHEEPESMGNDDYVRQQSNARSFISDGIDDDATSQRTTSTAHLTGASMGRTGSIEQRRPFTSDKMAQPGVGNDDGEVKMKAGMPIGFLAALGTRYAKKPIYRSRKCKILCPILGGITAAVTIIITLFPVLRAVAVHTLSTTVMVVSGSNITNPTNSAFALTLEGQAHKVGIFPAHLFFEEPVSVYWIAPENLTQELFLGQFALAPIGVAAGHGRIKQQTVFNITNEPAFARFTEFLITQEEFTWRLKSNNVQAKAFSFIAVNGLTFVKDLTLPGMANMTDISISDFQLPGDDPAGGISLAVTTKLTNPSAFGVEIGTLQVGLYYNNIYLGPAQTVAPINLTSGVNTIDLVGRMIPYTDNNTALQALSTVFSNYLNGIVTPVQARGVSVTLPDGSSVDWLTKGIKALTLSVPLQSPTGRISPITSITIEQLSLGFDSVQPYAPTTNSSHIKATFGLPFGFSLDIVELSNAFTIVDNQTAVTSLSAPLALADSMILTRNAGYTTGSLNLNLPLSRLVTPPSYTDHLIFDQFNYDFTVSNGANFILIGNTSVVTNTPIGQVLLTNIGFTVPAGLIGLGGLTQYPTNILSVDVIGGNADAVILAIDVGMTNPSNLDLTVGNVTFQLYNGKDFLGTTTLPDLHLTPGYQVHSSVGYLYGNANAGAHQTLAGYAQGNDAHLSIMGFNGSSATTSLTQAFMAIHLNTTLTGLTSKLLNYANLTVLPTTGVSSDMAASIVSLQNPFTAPLLITNIQSNITAYGLHVGSIVQDVNFPASGKAATNSPTLNFNLNLFPPDIFSLLRALVVSNGQLPVAAVDGIVALGGYTYVPTAATSAGKVKRSISSDEEQDFADGLVSPAKSGSNPGSDLSEHMFTLEAPATEDLVEGSGETARQAMYDDMFTANTTDATLYKRAVAASTFDYSGFDLPTYVLTAFKSLEVTVELLSVLKIGDFVTDLAYNQTGVPAYTDSSLTLLLPILAQPIVQRIVDASILGINSVNIIDPTNTAFTTGLIGSITQAGPFDASIAFPSGLTVAWNGAALGQISMPTVALVANVGAQLDISAAFAVANLAHLTDFTSYLLTEPSFVWQITGQNLSVAALGITVTGISISKNVVLDGMNGLKGGVIVNAFDLPSNDAAGGVHLTLATTITNPSSVGVALSTIGFVNSFGSTIIGPASSNAPFVLAPKAVTQLALSGRLIPQSTPQGLADVSTIFNGYIHGVPSNLIVAGNNAGPADCDWLNIGIKNLKINVVLPAAVNLQVINAIAINSLALKFTQANPYSPMFSTSDTVAKFQLPFAFPVDITNAATSITAHTAGGAGSRKRATGQIASLNVPMLPSKTDVIARTLLLQFQDIPFVAIDDPTFSNFLLQTTDGSSVSFGLTGAATTIVSTAIGNLLLSDVPFDVTTSLLGLQGLNAHPAVVSDLDVHQGFVDYLQINAIATLYNPSNITISTGDVSFALTFQGQTIGSALITDLTLVPGDNAIATAVHYSPTGGASTAAGQVLLENFVQGVVSNTLIDGTANTTPITSLQAALASIQLATTIPPIHQNLITEAALTFPTDIATTGIASSTFMLANPFTASINLFSVQANATYQGIFLGEINSVLSTPITAPGHSLITSKPLPLALNIDPIALSSFLIAASSAQGVDLGPLSAPLSAIIAGTNLKSPSLVTSKVGITESTCDLSASTNAVNNIILSSLKNLKTDLKISSATALDLYKTNLDFVQKGVPTDFDNTVLYLTGILGKSIVPGIVDASVLHFDSGLVTQVTDNGFTASLKGSLLNAGPFDAFISFPDGVAVYWEGHHIANITLPPICSTAYTSVPNLATTGVLTIVDQTQFTAYATSILHDPSFTWTITTNTLQVEALATTFNGITLTKVISFSAFNGLPGVSISNPQFPGDSGTSIILKTDSIIPSPSNLGIDLGHVEFIASFEGQEVGPISGDNLVLAPLANTSTSLSGFIIQRTGAASSTSLGHLFSQFLAGSPSTLQVTGVSVTSPAQPNSPVKWLTAAFKTLTLDVVLPGQKFKILSQIALKDLAVQITDGSQAYAPVVSNNLTQVTYKNPFGFSLTAASAGGAFHINYGGVDAALLTLPVAPVLSAETSTGQDAALTLNFKNQILQSQDTAAFNNFFAAVTNKADVAFNLHGTTTVLVNIAPGQVQITGIPFDVPSTFPGINSFGGVATIPATPRVVGGFTEYLLIKLSVILANPAPLNLITNDVSFAVIYQGVNVGRSYVNMLDLLPGSNTLASDFHYQPADPSNAIAQSILAEYLMPNSNPNIAITVQGDSLSSPYGSLVQGLEGITLPTSFPRQGIPIVKHIYITLDAQMALCSGTATFTTNIVNHLETFVSVTTLKGTASQGGTLYSTFNQAFPNEPIYAPAGGAAGADSNLSGPITTVLTKGPTGSYPLLFNSDQGLDIDITSTVSIGGYVAPSLEYKQTGVPYTISYSVAGFSVAPIPAPLTQLLAPIVTNSYSNDVASRFSALFAAFATSGPAFCSLITGSGSGASYVPPLVVPSVVASVIANATAAVGSVVNSALAPLTSSPPAIVTSATAIVGGLLSSIAGGAAARSTAAVTGASTAARAASTGILGVPIVKRSASEEVIPGHNMESLKALLLTHGLQLDNEELKAAGY